jgi:hypothetical protein
LALIITAVQHDPVSISDGFGAERDAAPQRIASTVTAPGDLYGRRSA